MNTGISYQVVEQAQEGNANMQYQLANYLYVGDEQKAPNKEQGFLWMQAAAENGSVKAQKVLGLLYTNGQYSPWPAQDLEKGVYWYERAARAGDAEAMYWLYCCYNKGVGVVYDRDAAGYWLDQAVRHGYDAGDELQTAEPAEPVVRKEEPKPWEQYDLEEEPSARPSRGKGRARDVSLREKSLDMAQDGVLFVPKHDMEYVKSAATSGIVALSIGIIACCIIALLINAINKEFFASSRKGMFLLVSALISLGLGAFAFRRSYLAAYDEARQNAWFRQTAFFRQYRVDYDKLSNTAMLQYDYYSALEKSFHPLAYGDVIPRDAFREFRGYMFMGLFFGERGESAVPDFVIVTEKAVYVVQCLKIAGRLLGDIHDEAWEHVTPTGRHRMIPNPVFQNEQRLRIIEKDLGRFCPWAVTHAMTLHSMVVAGEDADISAITGEKRREPSHLLKASPEELRSSIEVIESKHTLHEEEAMELTKALEQIAQEYEERSRTFGKEML